MVRMLTLAMVLALAVPAASGQFNNPGITPTKDGVHGQMVDFAAAGHAVGMSTPPVGGTEGHTTVGGFSAYQFSGMTSPDLNHAGLCSAYPPPYTIAFNIDEWGPEALGPPIDWTAVATFAATAYHEGAHAVYSQFFNAWADANPVQWQQFIICITNLGKGWGPTKTPCGEAYAADASSTDLCADKQAICDDEYITTAVKETLLNAIDAWITAENETCNSASADCATCNGPMPPGWNGCPGPCICN